MALHHRLPRARLRRAGRALAGLKERAAARGLPDIAVSAPVGRLLVDVLFLDAVKTEYPEYFRRARSSRQGGS
ncbi:MAG: hypothetical protein M5U28_37415 [Sandaracinaceae bacterium]|nr:hypothetical protein [Sandaracinaceae bacterium]